MPDVKSGVETSEHKVAQSGSLWGNIATVLGLVITLGSTVAPVLGEGTKAGAIAGAVITLAGIVETTLVKLGYIKSRTEVKAAAALGGKK